MSCPLASVVNPQNPNQVLLFYLTGNQSPGLEIQDVGATDTTPTAFTDNLSAPVDSNIVNPGSFSALNSNGLLNLYGLVNDGTPAQGNAAVDAIAPKRLAQLSPVYKLLLPSSPKNTVVGIAMTTIVDDKGQGYMYCMTNSSDKPRITEFKVGWNSSSRSEDIITKNLDNNPPLIASNLAAAFDPASKKKFIVYQNQDELHMVESTSDNDVVIGNTNDSRDNTGLALVPVTTDKGTKLYLYYFPLKGGKLQRVIRNEDGTWQDSATAESLTSDPNTFLSATKVGNAIMVYYIVKGEFQIHSFKDQI